MELIRKEAERPRGRRVLEQSIVGPCSRREGTEGWWQRPTQIRKPRAEGTKSCLSCLELGIFYFVPCATKARK